MGAILGGWEVGRLADVELRAVDVFFMLELAG